ncbi:MAG: DUF1616 domain-containing protein [Candidatus Bathyarchaeota archaeon]|nr:DUF1616 domain-containing protein [Candidatus Bathyarchaeota archaeon]
MTTKSFNDAGSTFSEFLFSEKAAWYWIIVAFTVLTVVFVLLVPGDFVVLQFLRILFGGVFLAFLPGYALIRLLFPPVTAKPSTNAPLNVFARFVLSLGSSLLFDSMVGLLLNYTPWAITLVPLTTVLVVFTLSFATVSIIREYQTVKNSKTATD